MNRNKRRNLYIYNVLYLFCFFLVCVFSLAFIGLNRTNFWQMFSTSMFAAYGYTATPMIELPEIQPEETAIFAKKTIVPERVPEPFIPTPTTFVLVVKVKTNIEGGNLNMRAGPSMTYRVLKTLQESEYVKFLDCNGDWVEIEHQGVVGYTHGKYLENDPCVK